MLLNRKNIAVKVMAFDDINLKAIQWHDVLQHSPSQSTTIVGPPMTICGFVHPVDCCMGHAFGFQALAK